MIPDFQGGFVVAGSTIQRFDGLTGQPYPAYSSPNLLLGTPRVLVHTDGTIFASDGSSIIGIDPSTGATKFSVALERGFFSEIGDGCLETDPKSGRTPPEIFDGIIAGDGYAYFPYSYGSSSAHRLLEVLISLNTAYLLVSVIFADFPLLLYRFYPLEFLFDKWVGIEYTHMNPYRFSYATVTLCVAFCLWIALRTFSDIMMVRMFLYSGAWLTVILGHGLFFALVGGVRGEGLAGFRYTIPFECFVALSCGILFLNKNLRPPIYVIVSFLVVHHAYWFWAIGLSGVAAYSGPCGLILGFCAALAWSAYVRRNETVWLNRSPETAHK